MGAADGRLARTSRATARAPTGPAASYVDWIGADIYGKFPNFGGLNGFYKHYRGKPFVIGEWGPWDVDQPAFTRHLFRWVRKHGRAKMAIYYQGFGPGNPFQLRALPGEQEGAPPGAEGQALGQAARPTPAAPADTATAAAGPDGVPPPPEVRELLGSELRDSFRDGSSTRERDDQQRRVDEFVEEHAEEHTNWIPIVASLGAPPS